MVYLSRVIACLTLAFPPLMTAAPMAAAQSGSTTVSCQTNDDSFVFVLNHDQRMIIAHFRSGTESLSTVRWRDDIIVATLRATGSRYTLNRHTGGLEIVHSDGARFSYVCKPSKPIM